MDFQKTAEFVRHKFDESITQTLVDYIKIPNLSPSFDADGTNAADTEKVISLFTAWIAGQELQGASTEVVRIADENGLPRTPIIVVEVEAYQPGGSEAADDTVLLYGHMDKQPPFEGWKEGLGPYSPVIQDGRLYGRGGADDGYAVFGSVTAVRNCQVQGVPHPRCVILIEACEESGSPDLPFYVEKLVEDGRMRDVSLVVCLDSGAMSYDALWITSSLRGVMMAELTVQTLTAGVHSGDGSGVCSDSFRILRNLLSTIEDADTGKMADPFCVPIPAYRVEEIESVVAHMSAIDGKRGASTWDHFPLVSGKPMLESEDSVELLLDRTWRPTLTVVGQDGLPPCAKGGNVLRPSTTLKLSIRLPPTFNTKSGEETLRKLVEGAAPPDAQVKLDKVFCAPGWNAPAHQAWLKQSLDNNASAFFGSHALAMGEGGSIPFMGMLGDMFPRAQFVVTGVLGPDSNAHGPNEFLDLNYCQGVICVISHVLADHRARRGRPLHEWTSGSDALPGGGMQTSLSRVDGAAQDKFVAQSCHKVATKLPQTHKGRIC